MNTHNEHDNFQGRLTTSQFTKVQLIKIDPLFCCGSGFSGAGLLGGEVPVPVGLPHAVPVSISGTVWSDISI